MRWAALLLDGDVSVFSIRVIDGQKSETPISPNLASLKKERPLSRTPLLTYSTTLSRKDIFQCLSEKSAEKTKPFKETSGAVFRIARAIVPLKRAISKLLNRVCLQIRISNAADTKQRGICCQHFYQQINTKLKSARKRPKKKTTRKKKSRQDGQKFYKISQTANENCAKKNEYPRKKNLKNLLARGLAMIFYGTLSDNRTVRLSVKSTSNLIISQVCKSKYGAIKI